MLEKKFDGVTAYTQSKLLALVMFTFDLAEQLKQEHILVNCLHPGTYLDTNMVREAGIDPQGTAESGADTLVYFATCRIWKVLPVNISILKKKRGPLHRLMMLMQERN